MVQGFLRLAAKDLRERERRVGSPASGREDAAYSRDRRAHRPGRAEESPIGAGEERGGRKENLPHQER